MVVVNNMTTDDPVKFDNESMIEEVYIASKIVTVSAAMWDNSDIDISDDNPVSLQFRHAEPVGL